MTVADTTAGLDEGLSLELAERIHALAGQEYALAILAPGELSPEAVMHQLATAGRCVLDIATGAVGVLRALEVRDGPQIPEPGGTFTVARTQVVPETHARHGFIVHSWCVKLTPK